MLVLLERQMKIPSKSFVNYGCHVHVVADNHAVFSVVILLKLQTFIYSAARCDNFSADLMTGYIQVYFAVCNMHSNCKWISYLPGE